MNEESNDTPSKPILTLRLSGNSPQIELHSREKIVRWVSQNRSEWLWLTELNGREFTAIVTLSDKILKNINAYAENLPDPLDPSDKEHANAIERLEASIKEGFQQVFLPPGDDLEFIKRLKKEDSKDNAGYGYATLKNKPCNLNNTLSAFLAVVRSTLYNWTFAKL